MGCADRIGPDGLNQRSVQSHKAVAIAARPAIIAVAAEPQWVVGARRAPGRLAGAPAARRSASGFPFASRDAPPDLEQADVSQISATREMAAIRVSRTRAALGRSQRLMATSEWSITLAKTMVLRFAAGSDGPTPLILAQPVVPVGRKDGPLPGQVPPVPPDLPSLRAAALTARMRSLEARLRSQQTRSTARAVVAQARRTCLKAASLVRNGPLHTIGSANARPQSGGQPPPSCRTGGPSGSLTPRGGHDVAAG
jgi:hypothetical protein